MPLKHEWQSRIKAVEREYVAMRQAADRFLQEVQNDPNIVQDQLRRGEIVAASENLEGTYIMRLFAEFEAGARQYWGAKIRRKRPQTAILLDRLAARRRIPHTQLENAHLVRNYRNSLVHEREEKSEFVSIDRARHHLCNFFSFMPEQW